ncbi:MAG: hypothetical protein QOH63_1822 [Acidobacteriota bacterium]|jgi:hypothetical protein|nr:hypothetical protein [Acidobacteriota bacterium]
MTFAASKVLKRKSCEDEWRGCGSSSNLGFRTFLVEMLRDLRTTKETMNAAVMNDELKSNHLSFIHHCRIYRFNSSFRLASHISAA